MYVWGVGFDTIVELGILIVVFWVILVIGIQTNTVAEWTNVGLLRFTPTAVKRVL